MPGVDLLAALAVGYVIGAVPSGVLVGRLRGVDPRGSGSGRTGTTNALRTLGPRWAVVVAVLDVAKGIIAVLIGNAIGPEPWGGALASVAAVIGHVRSVFIGFTGGRGAATGAGAMLVLAPLAVVVALAEFAVVVWRTRLVSLGSLLAAVTVALVAAALYAAGRAGVEVLVAATLIAAVVVLAHADNIERLRNGTERRIGDA
ncbi:MAG TPA: glycerol-3-phosphate 1-O-acyltransferase PlsY [Candidatus Binatia bacterium]|nr:glycerol-3-phosphate 1-O-acyltransferase PlsY [Candidatus Binatia bacterium]